MRQNGMLDWLSKQRGRWREWVGWLILIGYVAVLYWMASLFWHVLYLFLFISIFVVLTFLVTIGFKFLQSRKPGEEANEPAANEPGEKC